MTRKFEVKTPLGPEDLLFFRMKVTEELGRLFEIDLELLSLKLDINLTKLLGEGMTVTTELPEGGKRYYHGLVCRVVLDGMHGKYYKYRATLRPWFWYLTRSADCRIFQKMTVPDIVKKVFGDHGFSDFQDKLSGNYTKWDYRVQYRETAFTFLSRLMEHEGIYYFFTHENGKHILVLCDGPSSHATVSGYDKVPFYPPSSRSPRVEHLWEWELSQEVQPVKASLTDYDFTRPSTSLLSQKSVSRSHAHGKGEIFDYPGYYQQASDGSSYANVRLNELSAQYEQVGGCGDAQGLSAGALFTLSGFSRSDQNREYLIVAIESEMQTNLYETDGSTDRPTYVNRLRAISNTETFRSARSTPKSIVRGAQTAVVVGPSDKEIYTDEYGRVKVQFFWDRVGKKDENSSCWVRVGQSWAGTTWGSIFIPRIGQEVIVDFLEGDPDQPIITGSVFNAKQMPPFKLNANMTQSGIKTRSTMKGNDTNFNELRFEDKMGSESIFFHAERDFIREVENNDMLTVGIEKDANGNPVIGLAGKGVGNQTITLYNNQTLTVGKKVGNTSPKEGSQTVEIWNTQTVTIGKGKANCNDGSQTVDIYKSRTVTLETGNDSLTVTQGNQTIKISAGSSSLEAMQSITLKVGENSIKLTPEGIAIKGIMVTIEGQAALTAKAPICEVSADAMLTLKAGAMATLKGGLVMIN